MTFKIIMFISAVLVGSGSMIGVLRYVLEKDNRKIILIGLSLSILNSFVLMGILMLLIEGEMII